jgi:rhamnulokinase
MKRLRLLAFDLGAESGRAVVGELRGRRLAIREIARFPNGPINVRGHLHWNLFGLAEHVKDALRRCAASPGPPPDCFGFDTWGVDFALLDRQGQILGLPFAYRDRRAEGAMASFFRRLPRRRVYERTGIQMLPINTLFQLEAMVRDRSPLLETADRLLFIPDLFHYLLTGAAVSEFTFATTSQLFNPRAMDWDDGLLAALGLPKSLMAPLVTPGSLIGRLDAEVAAAAGLPRLPLAAVGCHDTASAVAAVPAEGDDWAYLSSGTWSLLGVESPKPVITNASFRANVTNEGGVGGTFRVLKNVMGLWLLQQCRRVWSRGKDVGYDELTRLAADAKPFAALIDPDDPSFLNPPDMPEAIRSCCRRTGQRPPADGGPMARCILESLALKYRLVIERLRQVQPRPIRRLHVIGGGSRNRLLCQMTADATGLPVLAGPVEATAIGNLLVQATALGCVNSLTDLREIVRRSFAVETFEPRPSRAWERAWERFDWLTPPPSPPPKREGRVVAGGSRSRP